MKSNYLIIGFTVVTTVSCNMPTPTSDIITTDFSGVPYENMDCSSLKLKLNELKNLEYRFSTAQDIRIDDSKGHAAYYGWGRGDGMDTIELAKARGKYNAVHKVYDNKNCNHMK